LRARLDLAGDAGPGAGSHCGALDLREDPIEIDHVVADLLEQGGCTWMQDVEPS
jgi:hypothetical protein